MASTKLMITVAPTGGMASKAQNANLPTQPGEIAESVHKSFKAGACIAALHARRPDDQATCNADIYRDIRVQTHKVHHTIAATRQMEARKFLANLS